MAFWIILSSKFWNHFLTPVLESSEENFHLAFEISIDQILIEKELLSIERM